MPVRDSEFHANVPMFHQKQVINRELVPLFLLTKSSEHGTFLDAVTAENCVPPYLRGTLWNTWNI